MSKKTKNEKQVDTILEPYKNVDYDFINNSIKVTGNDKELGYISKKTIENIAKWALNGSTQEEIAHNLELSKKQFETLCNLCPFIISIMQSSHAYADIIVAGTLFERAVGKCKVKKKQPMRVHDYDETGRVIGEHYEIVEYEEELPPEPNLLKFLAEHRLSEHFGEDKADTDGHIKNVVGSLDATQMKEVEAQLKGEIK